MRRGRALHELIAAGSEGEKMKIADILETKGSTVHSVLPWLTVTEVVDRLGMLGIGAVLVCDENSAIAGIVSERDIVRALRKHGADLLTLPVSEVMTHYVQTTHPDETVAHAMARMTAGRYRHLPVIDSGRLVGMVSIGDLVKHRVREMELETGVLRDALISRY
ncbi:CBS domain-containing protein [Pseudonocardia sp. DLS-67]